MWSLAPVGLAVLVMLPRLASPQFGLLDDGLTLQTGRQVIGGWMSPFHLIPETGRFFPAYWLAYAAVVGVVGARPLAFFMVNVLLLAGLIAVLAQLVRLGGGTRTQATIASVLFALSGPVVETFYTLSKAESLQLTWTAASLLAAAASATGARGVRLAGLLTLAGAALLLACATKETSLVLVPIAFVWLAIELWLGRAGEAGRRFAGRYAGLSVVAAAMFLALRWTYAPRGLAEGTYTRAYALDSVTVSVALFRIAAWLLRDFAFLLPLLALAILTLRDRPPAGRRVILYAGVWTVGWLAVYVPWPATFSYYLLPFGFGVALLAGTVVGDIAVGRRGHASAMKRGAAWSLLTASVLLWPVAIVNAAMDARVQLAVDRANADLVEFLGGLPARSRVIVNTNRLNEYLFELPLHLSQIKQRPDVVVEHVTGPAAGGLSSNDIFVATPEMANRPWPTVRVPFDEPGVRHDNAMLSGVLAGRGELVYQAKQHTRLVELGIHRLLCRVAPRPILDGTYCPGDRLVIDAWSFSYGWQVHRLGRPST
jgi:hypothetical protein